MISKQGNTFIYLDWSISYQEKKDIHSKTTISLHTLGLLNNTLKTNLVQRSIRLKSYKTLALPILLYGSEILTLNNATNIGYEWQK
jgi:hypothetical protein